jgi:small subunit ribosomal protein S18
MKPSNSKSTSSRGPKGRENPNKKIKKKTSILLQEKVDYVDYKDANLLARFVSDRSKIRARRVSGNDVQQQRDIAQAIKLSREMALLPYAKRVTTQRTGRPDRGERGERGPRRDEAATDAVEEIDDLDVDVDEVETVEAEELS